MKRGDCGCRGRRRKPKVKYPDKATALTQILRRYRRTAAGPMEVYECPNGFDCWHLRTVGESAKNQAVTR